MVEAKVVQQVTQHINLDLTILFLLLTGCHWSTWQHRGAGFDWPKSEYPMFYFFEVLMIMDLFWQALQNVLKSRRVTCNTE